MVKSVIFALPIVASAVGTCSDLCADGGHGTQGFISGTAPFCGGTCADCGDGHCYQVESGSVSDYGSGCATGNKVCCCSKAFQLNSDAASVDEETVATPVAEACPFTTYTRNSEGDCATCEKSPWYDTDKKCTCGPSAADWITAAQVVPCSPTLAVAEACPFTTHTLNSEGICATCEKSPWYDADKKCTCGPSAQDWITAAQVVPCSLEEIGATNVSSTVTRTCYGPSTKVYRDADCENIGGATGSGSVSDAHARCDKITGCNAFNLNLNTHQIYFRACSSSAIGKPSGTAGGYVSYYCPKSSSAEVASSKPIASDVGVGTCSDLCADGGHGSVGFISGTAPFCGGTCADCGDGHCYQVESGSVSDYGSGCATGNKVCCCSKASSEVVV